ncbi:hypothetical protein DTO271G3_1147 [Paecilomyces variotii]|nr:hypothetical protein DTO271G3_1147 [Paecilomyces variotii]
MPPRMSGAVASPTTPSMPRRPVPPVVVAPILVPSEADSELDVAELLRTMRELLRALHGVLLSLEDRRNSDKTSSSNHGIRPDHAEPSPQANQPEEPSAQESPIFAIPTANTLR